MNDCSQSLYLRIGSLLCEINSKTATYANMLAEAYSTSLIDREPSNENNDEIELKLFISEAPNTKPGAISDALIVTPTKDGYQIETDPISCSLVLEPSSAKSQEIRANIVIRQATMEASPLGYHLYLITNRILLLLDVLLVHAAAIELNGVVNLFCGHKGAGKSTLSVFLAQSGASILADDRIILRRSRNEFWVSGCSSNMKVMSNTEEFLLPNQLHGEASLISGIPKKVFNAGAFFSVIPHVDRKPTRLFLNQVASSFRLKEISANEALVHMIDRTGNMYRFGGHNDYSSFLSFLAAFINQVELYSLELSPDLTELPLVLEMLNDLDSKVNQGAGKCI